MNKSLRSGFTLVEMLVVVSVIVLLIGVGLSSLWGSTGIARDKDRINDMEQLRLALRLYQEANGEYPPMCAPLSAGDTSTWAGPGVFASPWGRQCDDYIVGLVPTYLPELPQDPLFEDIGDWGYLYQSDGTSYKFLVHFSVEENVITSNSDKYARRPNCSNDYGEDPFQPTVYAIYGGSNGVGDGTDSACW